MEGIRKKVSEYGEFEARSKYGRLYLEYLRDTQAELTGSAAILYPKPPASVGGMGAFFEFQKQTSGTIRGVKDLAIGAYLKNRSLARDMPGFPPTEGHLFHIHKKSGEKIGVRGVQSRIYNLALGGEEDEYVPRIGASLELLMDHMYYVNQVLDQKSHGDPRVNTFAAKSNLEVSRILLNSAPSFDGRQGLLDALSSDYDEILDRAYDGADIDCNFNSWARLRGASFDGMLDPYVHRTYLMQALFFVKTADMMANLAEHRGKKLLSLQTDALKKYAYSLGMGMQVVNDISDFVPPEHNEGTRTKLPTDAYRDVKNGAMTLPIILMLHMADEPDKKTLRYCMESGGGSSDENLLGLTKIFVRSGAYRECRALARSYKDTASRAAKQFPEPARSLLSHSSVMLDSNRYYRILSSFPQD